MRDTAQALAIETIAAKPVAALHVASLPMYDLPQVVAHTDALWQTLAARLHAAGLAGVPHTLTRNEDYAAAWHDPSLLLGQSCGFPLLKQFAAEVRIVATPLYSAPGCEGAEHRSFFIANRADRRQTLAEYRGSICALNGSDSNTGMNLLRRAIAPLSQGRPFFRSIDVTGSHYKSLQAVAEDRAHLTAIDCVSFAYFQRYEPELTAEVVQIGQSVTTPCPPFITSAETDDQTLARLRAALREFAADPQLASLRAALFLEGFVFEEQSFYDKILRIEEEAIALGYPELR